MPVSGITSEPTSILVVPTFPAGDEQPRLSQGRSSQLPQQSQDHGPLYNLISTSFIIEPFGIFCHSLEPGRKANACTYVIIACSLNQLRCETHISLARARGLLAKGSMRCYYKCFLQSRVELRRMRTRLDSSSANRTRGAAVRYTTFGVSWRNSKHRYAFRRNFTFPSLFLAVKMSVRCRLNARIPWNLKYLLCAAVSFLRALIRCR